MTADAGSESALVPRSLAVAAAWGWRLLVLGTIGWFVLQILGRIPVLVVALSVAMLLTALLAPGIRVARAHRWNAGVASVLLVLGFAAVFVGAITVIANGVSRSLTASSQRLSVGWSTLIQWLGTGPLHVNVSRWDAAGTQLRQWSTTHAAELTRGAWTVGSSAIEVVVGVLVCLLTTILLLADGRRIWRSFMVLVPAPSRGRVHRAARAGWRALGAYVHAQMLIASVEGVLITLGALILGVPLAPVLGVLVFVTAFIPLLGILIAGIVCVALALVAKGALVAVVMLVVVVVVHELEMHILQPWLMGHAVAVHPLGVVVVVTGATMLAGIAGALFAVPLVAFLNAAIRALVADRPQRVGSAVSAFPADAVP